MAGDDPAGSSGFESPQPEHVRWQSRPDSNGVILLVAFEGWSDAGDAATTAVRYLGGQWGAEPFATIDPEIFYDFSATRPQVQFDAELQRDIVWPSVTFALATAGQRDADVVTVVGPEPQLRWRTFTEQIVAVAHQLGAEFVLTFGALLAEVPHNRPSSVFATSSDDQAAKSFGLVPSRYEGPTGITGVLHTACHAAGLQSASLWAAVPTYVPAAPSPKAALALIERAAQLLDLSVNTTELEIAAASYERQVDELVGDDEETRDYVDQLVTQFDRGTNDPFGNEDSLVDEVERFLRDQPE
jgi:proteasome assembly chaperone (PAC2) family protein